MPTTPNRLYPYPAAGDPVDVPGDIQALAEAICADLVTVSDLISARPSAQIRSSQPQSVATAIASGGLIQPVPLIFDSVDFDTGGFTNLATQPTLLTLTAGEIYWVWATVKYPGFTNATEDPFVTFDVRSTDLTPIFLGGDNLEVDTGSPGILSRIHTINGVMLITAGDTELQASVMHNSEAGSAIFTEASFGAMQIRETP